MKYIGIWMLGLSVLLASPAYSGSPEEIQASIDQLERELTRTKKKLRALNSRVSGNEEAVKVNGFFSIAAAMGDENGVSMNGITDELNTQSDSVVGVQGVWKVDDKTSMTIQMVGVGDDGFKLGAEWAFISYQVAPQTKVRAGRLRTPLYVYSESLQVGYSYPWVRPPHDVYSELITGYEGVDVIHTINSGDWRHSFGAYIGRGLSDNSTEVTFFLQDTFGVNMSSSTGNWSTRIGFVGGDVVATPKPSTNFAAINDAFVGIGLDPVATPQTIQYFAVGGKYDDGNLRAEAEWTKLEFDDGFFSDTESYFVSLGYRINKWMPYVVYSHSETGDEGNKRRDAMSATLNGTAANLSGVAGLIGAGAATPAHLIAAGVTTDPVVAAAILADPAAAASAASGLATKAAGLQGVSGFVQSNTQESSSYSVGAKYDLTSRMSLKFQYDHLFDLDPTDSTPGSSVTGATGDTANFYTIVLDAVF